MTKKCNFKVGRFVTDLENRCTPAVITYPLASSIIIFDPKGDREPEPTEIDDTDLQYILVPPMDILQSDDVDLTTSGIA